MTYVFVTSGHKYMCGVLAPGKLMLPVDCSQVALVPHDLIWRHSYYAGESSSFFYEGRTDNSYLLISFLSDDTNGIKFCIG